MSNNDDFSRKLALLLRGAEALDMIKNIDLDVLDQVDHDHDHEIEQKCSISSEKAGSG